jgi:DNA-binding LacI/PurR family transcriptional regulator
MTMVTQVEIARLVGLDVSSVNKILNEVPGPVFRKETIARVLKVASERGYDFSRPTKTVIKQALAELVPATEPNHDLAARLRVPAHRIAEIKRLLYGRAK